MRQRDDWEEGSGREGEKERERKERERKERDILLTDN